MNRGFTLIEIIAVLVLVVFLTATAAISLVPMAQGLMQVRENAVSLQKSRLAFARISREFTTISNVVSGTAQTIVYWFVDSTKAGHRRTLSWSGTAGEPLRLNGIPLMDDVVGFQLSYYANSGGSAQASWTTNSRAIEMILQTPLGGHTNRIVPRNVLFPGE